MVRNAVKPTTPQVALIAPNFFQVECKATRNRTNFTSSSFREKTRRTDIAPRTGRTIGAENFDRKSPDKLNAAKASVAGEIFWSSRQKLQIVAVKKNAAATSAVTRALWARK